MNDEQLDVYKALSADLAKRVSAVEALIRAHVGDAVRAFAAELQCRRPGMLDDEAAAGEMQRGAVAARTALRFAAAAGNPDLLAEVRQQLELFLAPADVERWIKEGRNG